ncbi:class I SAM-dependent methyltransferase [Dietzia sp. PP-33]|jgi:methylation protein EvaC|uniref:class I SAM-dependent methyltransferase n=1 Tax=Dietzia sp. PP-33 TaxID=2957500 RepID=UPI0029BA7751|nr:class I SAM-dependent methyltransferase [Dietzia sp. PP-33]MDX2358849.1 class I SAM-dependent methyltransferase [Dietzia sp. PP-33]
MTSKPCTICRGPVREFHDFGMQPLSDAFRRPGDDSEEYLFRLAVGMCGDCTMVQLMEEVDRDKMFHESYPFVSGGSAGMRAHFAGVAGRFLENTTGRGDDFVVELGSNDGTMLSHLAEAGMHHLGVEPSAGVARLAVDKGVRVLGDFFEAESAARIRAEHGPATVIYAANTLCHIPYLDSVFAGVDELLAPEGIMVFEDPYLGDIVEKTSFDQIYDEHFYLFSARSVGALAQRHGLELVDVESLPVHGGEVRYTLARRGAREVSDAVTAMIAAEERSGLTEPATLEAFSQRVSGIRRDLVAALTDLRAQGLTVVGYGATAKSATVLNMCGIGPDLVPRILDNTTAKQGLLTPGSRIPVVDSATFSDPYPDVAVLFAWNHAREITTRETGFLKAGGRWLLYVPGVHEMSEPAGAPVRV